jgi:lipopolysaccharide export system protein LptA
VYETETPGGEITVLLGNAEIRANNLALQADRIEIHAAGIDCIGNVRGVEEGKNIIFEADRLRYYWPRKIIRMEGNATLEDRENGLTAKGGYIEFDEDEDIAVIQTSVRLFKGDMVGSAEYAVYRRQEQMLELAGSPVVFEGDDEYRAARIRVDLITNDVTMEGWPIGIIRN